MSDSPAPASPRRGRHPKPRCPEVLGSRQPNSFPLMTPVHTTASRLADEPAPLRCQSPPRRPRHRPGPPRVAERRRQQQTGQRYCLAGCTTGSARTRCPDTVRASLPPSYSLVQSPRAARRSVVPYSNERGPAARWRSWPQHLDRALVHPAFSLRRAAPDRLSQGADQPGPTGAITPPPPGGDRTDPWTSARHVAGVASGRVG